MRGFRIARLLGPDTPFLSSGRLAAADVYEDETPSAGIVAGIGVVSGQEVVIVANDATVKRGDVLSADGEEAPAG
ncbi:MAG: carboxyl transferase domain-containing protein [Thermomicrobiales bacterium]